MIDVRRLWRGGKGGKAGFIVGNWRGFADVCDLSVGARLARDGGLRPTNFPADVPNPCGSQPAGDGGLKDAAYPENRLP
ncbi:hypothetical protein D3C85_1705900 [compost metagenome]